MNHRNVWVILNTETSFLYSITKFRILKIHKNMLIKSPKFFEQIRTNHHASSAYPINLFNRIGMKFDATKPFSGEKHANRIQKIKKVSCGILFRTIKVF